MAMPAPLPLPPIPPTLTPGQAQTIIDFGSWFFPMLGGVIQDDANAIINIFSTTNTNPYAGPVSSPVIVVDPKGNAIPVGAGEQLQTSKDGKWTQVKDQQGNQTGTRIDGGHSSSGHPDPRAQVPHAHGPGVTNPDGTPELPVNQ